MKKVKEPIRLREKRLANGNASLYLDIYHNGVRHYEFLKLYLIADNSKQGKEQNKTTLEIANQIKAKRIIELQSGEYDLKLRKEDDVPFFAYFDKVRSLRDSRVKSRDWNVVRRLIQEYGRSESITFRMVDRQFVKGLRDRVDDLDIKEGTKHIYWRVFVLVVNQAVRDGVLLRSPVADLPGFKQSEARRIYLTAEEVRRMANTPCSNDIIKRSFLFSCLTGLRLSDVRALSWDNVSRENGYTRITFRQVKTKWQEYLDINAQAGSLMGEPGEGLVFNLTYAHQHINRVIKKWAESAGVNKDISFHVARHTFATMMLSNGVDLYTVSKLVGHRDIKTTQIYAKVMDKDKQRAVDNMPDILPI